MKHRRRHNGPRNGNNQNRGNDGGNNNRHEGLPVDMTEEEFDAEIAMQQAAAQAQASENTLTVPQAVTADGLPEDNEGNAAAPAPRPQFEFRPPGEPPKIVRIPDIKKQSAAALLELAEAQGLENIARVKKQDLVFNLLKAAARRGDHIMADGVLELMPDGYGFLR